MALRSTIMKLAHRLDRTGKFTWGQSQRLAWFLSKMYAGTVEFQYRKMNGEIRDAFGSFESINTPFQNGCVKYYDWNKGAIRSFRAENFLTYNH